MVPPTANAVTAFDVTSRHGSTDKRANARVLPPWTSHIQNASLGLKVAGTVAGCQELTFTCLRVNACEADGTYADTG